MHFRMTRALLSPNQGCRRLRLTLGSGRPLRGAPGFAPRFWALTGATLYLTFTAV